MTVTERYVSVGGQRLRVRVDRGTDPSAVPLVLCNGIGASLEVLDPFVEHLPGTTVIRFDVPGTGGSPTSFAPYGFPYLAWVLGRLLNKLGFTVEPRTPAQFKPYQAQEIATWVKIAKDAGIQPGE